ncbi:Dps family protein [Maricaulis sp. CAU 1757]
MSINMGLTDSQRETMADAVTAVLADTYALYFKTHVYHWNVTGPRFHDLHALFEEQYNEMWAATDEIAERIRALDVVAPRTYSEMTSAASIKSGGEAKDADGMVRDLLEGHQAVVKTLRETLEKADEHGDEATADILAPRVTAHEKFAWMLRSTLG